MTLGLWLTALGLGLRHGIDWDHIAAIADLSSTAESRRRGFVLSFLYAVGHAAVVIMLGLAAIVFGASLPEGTDVWMGRVVGLTLVALGLWVLIELVRKGRDFRLRSRWILVISGTFAGLRRVREASARRRLTIEHEHEHEHEHTDGHEHADRHAHGDGDDVLDLTDPGVAQAHDHDHLPTDAAIPEIDLRPQVDDGREPVESAVAEVGTRSETAADALAVTAQPERSWSLAGLRARRPGHSQSHSGSHSHSHTHRHSHPHSHETTLAEAGAVTGNGTAAGIGVLHGVGFESPTQIAVFVASTTVVGAWAGFGLLVAWVLGLIVANSVLAGLAAFGLLNAERNFVLYATVAALVGIISLAIGTLLLLGIDDVLPALSMARVSLR